MKFDNTPDIALPMDNPEEAAHFFKEILGYETDTRKDYIHVKTKHYNLYLVDGDEYNSVLEFYVDDLEAAKERCLKGGCTILRWNERDHWLIHPQGFAFHLEQRKSK